MRIFDSHERRNRIQKHQPPKNVKCKTQKKIYRLLRCDDHNRKNNVELEKKTHRNWIIGTPQTIAQTFVQKDLFFQTCSPKPFRRNPFPSPRCPVPGYRLIFSRLPTQLWLAPAAPLRKTRRLAAQPRCCTCKFAARNSQICSCRVSLIFKIFKAHIWVNKRKRIALSCILKKYAPLNWQLRNSPSMPKKQHRFQKNPSHKPVSQHFKTFQTLHFRCTFSK